LTNTAFNVISDENIQHHIDLVVLTVRLAQCQLKFEHAAQELRDGFERLQARIQQYATESDGKTKENAEKLLGSFTANSDPDGQRDPARAHTPPTDTPSTAAASISAHSPQSAQTSPNPSDASPPVPRNDTVINFGSG